METITELLSQLETNVAYFERQVRGDNLVNFVDWKAASWTTDGGTFNGQQIPSQRVANYPNQIPQAGGIDDNVCVSALLPTCISSPSLTADT